MIPLQNVNLDSPMFDKHLCQTNLKPYCSPRWVELGNRGKRFLLAWRRRGAFGRQTAHDGTGCNPHASGLMSSANGKGFFPCNDTESGELRQDYKWHVYERSACIQFLWGFH